MLIVKYISNNNMHLNLTKKLVKVLLVLTFLLSVILSGVVINNPSNNSPMENTTKMEKSIQTKTPKILLKSSTVINQPYNVDFSSYFSSTKDSFGEGVAVDTQGNIYVTGFTHGGLPLKHAWNNTFGGTEDAFLAKFNSSGYLLFSTYFGRSGC